MDITISIVCRNEAGRIADCIESLRAQDFGGAHHELLIVDNGSTDRTVEVIRQATRNFPVPVRLIDNPRPGIAASRNVAVEHARFDHLLFIDADCVAPPGWLARYQSEWTAELNGHRIVAAGGGNVAPTQGNRFQRGLGIMLNSLLGSRGSTQGMVYQARRVIDHHPCLNLMLNRKAVRDAGGFDEKDFNFMGEDQDLSLRLNARGYKYLFVPGCAVSHQLRPTAGQWARNMYQYGVGRSRLIRRHPQAHGPLFQVIQVFGPAFVAGLLGGIVCGSIGHPLLGCLLALPAVAYLLLIAAVSTRLCLAARALRYTPLVALSFCITHLAYSLGMNQEAIGGFKRLIRQACGRAANRRAHRPEARVNLAQR